MLHLQHPGSSTEFWRVWAVLTRGVRSVTVAIGTGRCLGRCDLLPGGRCDLVPGGR